MNFKGLIFDMDGTIIDSMVIWSGISTQFLRDHNISPPDDIEEIVKPLGSVQCAEYFISTFNMDVDLEYTLNYFAQIMAKKYASVGFKPHALEFIQHQHSKGVKMCVATASMGVLAKPVLDRLGVSDYIDFFITCEDVKASKNLPTIYTEATKKMGLSIADVAVFEDTLTCVETCHNAGFYTVAIADDSSKHNEDKIKSLADKFITSFSELID